MRNIDQHAAPSRWRLAAVAVLLVVGLAAPLAAADAKAILLLHSYGYDAAGRLPFDAAFARAVRESREAQIDLYIESIDPGRFRGEAQAQLVRTYLRERYATTPIAVVATVYDRALAFLLDERDPLFPGVPVVAVLSGQPHGLPERVSVIWSGTVYGETAALALKLSPRAGSIALVDGAAPSPGSDAVYAEELTQIAAAAPGMTILPLRNVPLDELQRRLSTLPAQTPILVTRQLIGQGGGAVSTPEAIRALARIAPGPIYVVSDQQLGTGALGGMVVSIEGEAARLATLALRVAGDGALRVPPIQEVAAAVFDGRQLRRWGIEERRLPPDSIVRFREPGAWELYRRYILAGTFVLALQSGLIAGLVIQRARRRRIELALRGSEAALRQSFERNQDLAGRLIAAQEAERTRIARGLHDDVGQQLAGVGIMLSGLRRLLTDPDRRRDAEGSVVTLQDRTTALAQTIRHLSHELHPGVLTTFGMAAALRQHAAEVEEHYGITVTVKAPADLDTLHLDVALCLYRVTQEALANIARHAHATLARVELTRSDEAVELRVEDDGVGFVASERRTSGLGLRSIDERVRLARGSVRIESRPGRGTNLIVFIPLEPGRLRIAQQA